MNIFFRLGIFLQSKLVGFSEADLQTEYEFTAMRGRVEVRDGWGVWD